METVVLSVHILLAVSLVILVLLQQGKGADVGAVMGGGANSLFGVSGASNLLVKMTTSVAVAFMLTSVLLVRFAAARAGGGAPGAVADPLAGSGLASVPAAQTQSDTVQPIPGVNAPEVKAPEVKAPEVKAAPGATSVDVPTTPAGLPTVNGMVTGVPAVEATVNTTASAPSAPTAAVPAPSKKEKGAKLAGKETPKGK